MTARSRRAHTTRASKPGGGEPTKLLGDRARHVVHTVDGRHDVGGILGDHHVAEHEAPAGPEPLGDAGEQVRFAGLVEMVHGERGHDQVEAPGGQLVLEATHPQVGTDGGDSRHGEHLGALVDADQLRCRMDVEDATGRLARTDPELQHPLDANPDRRRGDGVLEFVVGRHLRTDHVQVGRRVEVELVTVGSACHHRHSGRNRSFTADLH